MSMYNVKADITKNRLYVTLEGFFNKNEMLPNKIIKIFKIKR